MFECTFNVQEARWYLSYDGEVLGSLSEETLWRFSDEWNLHELVMEDIFRFAMSKVIYDKISETENKFVMKTVLKMLFGIPLGKY